jgi:hypothetical protein
MAIEVNRALTLWAGVVALLGDPPDTVLTLGSAVAGAATRAKARSIGHEERKTEPATCYDLFTKHALLFGGTPSESWGVGADDDG